MSKKEKKKDEKSVLSHVLNVRIARKELPSIGELVIGTVARIEDHGAYVLLDEYGGLEAYAPASEILQSWFHDIKDYLRIGQKAVFRVIRVHPIKKLVDVSYRKVKDEERTEKFLRWKRTLRAVKLLELVAKKVNIPLQEMIEKVGWKLEDYFGDMYKGLEEVAKSDYTVLLKLGIDENLAKVIEEVAKQHIEIPEVTLSGIIRLINLRPNGVEYIRNILSNALKLGMEKGVKIRIYVVGPPRYRIDVTGKDPKYLEQVLNEIVNYVITEAKKCGGEATFQRIST